MTLDKGGEVVVIAVASVRDVQERALARDENPMTAASSFFRLSASSSSSAAAAVGGRRAAGGAVAMSAMEDENAHALWALGESLGRRVLVQNLRHVVVGLAGTRARWSDLLCEDGAVKGSGGGACGGGAAADGLRWLVKVLLTD